MLRFKQCYRGFLVGLMFLVGLFIVTVLFPAARIFGRHIGNLIRNRLRVLWYLGLASVLNVRLRRTGEVMSTPGMLVSNHISWLDIVVLGSQAPLDFVAKREVADWPVVGFLGRQAGTLFVRRGDHDSTRSTSEEMVWRLRRGRLLGLFPEGTSSSGDHVLRFHPRLFQPATLVNVPVQPVSLTYRGEARQLAPFVGDDEFLPHLWRLMALNRIDVDLILCPPIHPAKLDRSALAQAAHDAIVASLDLRQSTHVQSA